MNRQQAIAEAQRRWGSKAHAWIVAGTRFVTDDLKPAGTAEGWNHFTGQGKTWAAAFAMAETQSATHTRTVTHG